MFFSASSFSVFAKYFIEIFYSIYCKELAYDSSLRDSILRPEHDQGMCLPNRMRKMKNQMQRLFNKSNQFCARVIKALNRFLIKLLYYIIFLKATHRLGSYQK